jgi:hypothetical protein
MARGGIKVMDFSYLLKLEEQMKYARKKDAKRLKLVLDDLFKIDSNVEVIRTYIQEAGLEEYEGIVGELVYYRDVLVGKEEYIPYEEE